MSYVRNSDQDEPRIVRNDEPRVHDLVAIDLIERARGYETAHWSNEGRNALLSAYEEALGIVLFLKQELLDQAERFRAQTSGSD